MWSIQLFAVEIDEKFNCCLGIIQPSLSRLPQNNFNNTSKWLEKSKTLHGVMLSVYILAMKFSKDFNEECFHIVLNIDTQT